MDVYHKPNYMYEGERGLLTEIGAGLGYVARMGFGLIWTVAKDHPAVSNREDGPIFAKPDEDHIRVEPIIAVSSP